MTMSKGSEDGLKIVAIAAFVLIAAGIFYFEYFGTGSSPSPPVAANTPAQQAPASSGAQASGRQARAVGTASMSMDPTLHMEAMLVAERVVYSGSGRNIFSPNSAPPPVAIQKPIAPARPQTVAAVASQVPQGPPPHPPIPLKYFGIETKADGMREAFLLNGDNVYLATAGDVVLRRYKVIAVNTKTIEMEDMQTSDRQTLPLLVN